jgi:hypothetical protein
MGKALTTCFGCVIFLPWRVALPLEAPVLPCGGSGVSLIQIPNQQEEEMLRGIINLGDICFEVSHFVSMGKYPSPQEEGKIQNPAEAYSLRVVLAEGPPITVKGTEDEITGAYNMIIDAQTPKQTGASHESNPEAGPSTTEP